MHRSQESYRGWNFSPLSLHSFDLHWDLWTGHFCFSFIISFFLHWKTLFIHTQCIVLPNISAITRDMSLFFSLQNLHLSIFRYLNQISFISCKKSYVEKGWFTTYPAVDYIPRFPQVRNFEFRVFINRTLFRFEIQSYIEFDVLPLQSQAVQCSAQFKFYNLFVTCVTALVYLSSNNCSFEAKYQSQFSLSKIWHNKFLLGKQGFLGNYRR